MKKCKSKVYKEDVVQNTNKYKTANAVYQLIYIETNDGWAPCLLTANDLKNGIKRALKNVEDLYPKKKSIFDFF